MDKKFRAIKSYVLRAGRMSPAQQKAYDTLSDRYCIPYNDSFLSREKLSNGKDNIIIEIGFGMGDATYRIAMDNPENEYIGVEVHKPGVGKLLYQIQEYSIRNLRIIEHDAVEVLDKMIPDGSVKGFHIFFPDPWPKKKHHKRRLIQDGFVEKLAQKLQVDGYLYAVTDWDNYAEHILGVLTKSCLKNRYNGFAEAQDWRPGTKFERKGKEKSHAIYELLFEKSASRNSDK